VDDAGHVVEAGDALKVIPPRYQPQADRRIYLSSSRLNLRRPLEALASRLRDLRLAFLFQPGPWTVATDGEVSSDLDRLLEGWLGGARPVTILDLSGVPPTITRTLVGVLLRVVYDALFWGRKLAEGGRERPLLVVLEEAHAYLRDGDRVPLRRPCSASSERGVSTASGQWWLANAPLRSIRLSCPSVEPCSLCVWPTVRIEAMSLAR
jgi:hypothetical protein